MSNISSSAWLLTGHSPPLGALPLSAEVSLFSFNASLNIASESLQTSDSLEGPSAGAGWPRKGCEPDSTPLDLAAPRLEERLTAAPVVTSASQTRNRIALHSRVTTATARPVARGGVGSPSPTPTPAPRKLVERWEGWETETSTVYVTASVLSVLDLSPFTKADLHYHIDPRTFQQQST